ncbi:hypothetical protein RUM44_006039 [Polyplax serrata]|uniref:Heme oxygenase n=1 Tax=Polyplax serrata TaxID=468196 RepID=A0ABR1AZ95_POLSC
MKRATREAHAISDRLVNAKLLFALNNDSVWAEGLLVFYEIFKFLEIEMKKRPFDNIGKLFHDKMERTTAFEEDLAYYLGTNWKITYTIRDSVKNYLEHLKDLSDKDSDLLMAYVYHLYMGLLSGGQILQKKRQLQRKVMKTSEKDLGYAVTTFHNISISELKSQLRQKMNSIANSIDNSKKDLLVEESKKVFELNNSIIKTVKGAEAAAFKNIFCFLSFVMAALGVIYYLFRFTLG